MREEVPSFSIRSAELGPRASRTAWQIIMALSGAKALVRGDALEHDLSAWLLDSLLVLHTRMSRLDVEGGEAPRRRVFNHLLVVLTVAGRCHVGTEGAAFSLEAGEIGLVDAALPFSICGEACECAFLIVPRRAFATLGRALPEGLGGRLACAPGRLLAVHTAELVRQLPAMQIGDARPVCGATTALLEGCLLSFSGETPHPAHAGTTAVRRRVERYVEQNLGAPDLRPEAICRDLDIPRSTLYRAFEAVGGVSSFIRRRRLDTAHGLICHPEEHRSFAMIAEALGFETVETFSKAFQRRFGCSPRVARRGAAAGAAEVDTLFEKWRRAAETARGAARASRLAEIGAAPAEEGVPPPLLPNPRLALSA